MNDVKIRRTKAFLINTSKGDAIPIDEEEVATVIEAVMTKNIIVVRSGVVNPSFFVSITKDQERVRAWIEETKYDENKRKMGIQPLKSLFEGDTRIAGLLKGTNSQKQIEGGK